MTSARIIRIRPSAWTRVCSRPRARTDRRLGALLGHQRDKTFTVTARSDNASNSGHTISATVVVVVCP
jgi:hypothetical protein